MTSNAETTTDTSSAAGATAATTAAPAFDAHAVFDLPTNESEGEERQVFVGALTASLDKDQLNKHRIKYVVRVVEHPTQLGGFDHVSYCDFALQDDDDAILLDRVESVCDFVRNTKEGNVLIHCVAGQSRSAAVASAVLFRLTPQKLTMAESMAQIKTRRPTVRIRKSFVDQLTILEEKGDDFKSDSRYQALVARKKAAAAAEQSREKALKEKAAQLLSGIKN